MGPQGAGNDEKGFYKKLIFEFIYIYTFKGKVFDSSDTKGKGSSRLKLMVYKVATD